MIKIQKKYVFIIIAAILALSASIFFIVKHQSDDSYIKIGVLMPLTKANAKLGIDTKDGIYMCVDEINNSGGINGKKIKVLEYDDEGDPGKSLSGYNYFRDQNVSAVITGMYSSTTLAVVEEGRKHSIPIVVTTASADAITFNEENNEVYKNVYRVGFTNSFQGGKMADFAKMSNAKNAAVIYCAEDDYSLGLKDSFVNRCNSNGINVCCSENFAIGSVDFSRQLENIKAKNPDCIFVPVYYEAAGFIVQQARNLGINCSLFGGDSWSGVLDVIPDVSLLNNCFYFTGFSPDDPYGRVFNENFSGKNGRPATTFSGCGNDAMKVLGSAMSLVFHGNKEVKVNSDDFRENINDKLRDINIQGVTGNITFDEYHNPKKQAVIIQIKDGKEQFYQRI